MFMHNTMGSTVNQKPDRNASFLSFRCQSCGQEIEAYLDMAGTPSECPVCGNPLQVPLQSEAGTLWAEGANATANHTGAMKGRTIRIELSDDF